MRMNRGFTLIEVLVVIAIMSLLIAMMLPLLASMRGNAMRVVCANNLRQVALVVQSYTIDSRGVLPQGNSANPGTFKFPVGEIMDYFMRENDIPAEIWYCPALNNPLKSPAQWMSHATLWNAFNEFPIGYFYVGNPSSDSIYKFVVPVARNIHMSSGTALIFDYCTARRPSPTSGANVTKWTNFSHFGKDRPDGMQVLYCDFSLEYRNKEETRIGYKFIAPVNVYW